MSERIEVQRRRRVRACALVVFAVFGACAALAGCLLAGCLAALVMVNWDRWVGGAGRAMDRRCRGAADLTPLSAQVAGAYRRGRR